MSSAAEEENEWKDVVESLSETMKDVASLPECRHPAKKLYGSLLRRLKLLSPLFDEWRDRDEAPSSPQLWQTQQIPALRSLSLALQSSRDFLLSLNQGSKLYQNPEVDLEVACLILGRYQ
ncbi:hypothetical protein ACLOJK_034972 [Asimina triloba]